MSFKFNGLEMVERINPDIDEACWFPLWQKMPGSEVDGEKFPGPVVEGLFDTDKHSCVMYYFE